MGSSASKGARAAGSSIRKYPTSVNPAARAPAPSPAQPPKPGPGPSVHPAPQVSETRNEAIDVDAKDPAFASRLSSIGAVQPNPHYSPTSTSEYDPQRNFFSNLPSDMMQAPPQSAFPEPRDNPALRVLEARQRIQDEAEGELENVGRRGFGGRKFVDAGVITLALMRKSRGEPDSSIEEALGIKRGRMSVLGKGIVQSVQSA
ncbi:hypothetical protein K491DRAFT_592937 [Lophiostoma macrostomum CBS 122681]|uniref:Helix-turn-helix domain-containing protein n=1 Tax=Lophiostoma macrostomum CBS 122681 TaxID=1314788 RepID=A0A6A6TI08_9PLEO|nr:hypothetical protein K491DRAFT_592937 [Lophiostoma macrostomum CBS 122681]